MIAYPAPDYCHDPGVRLMGRVGREEPGAFAELVCQYEGRVFGQLLRGLGDRQEAEDLTQEVFLRLYRSRDRYQPRARLSTWLDHIARNVLRNGLRRRRRHAWLRYAPLEQTEARFPERFFRLDWPHDGDPLECSERVAQIRAALDGLAERPRQALEMQHFDDRSYPEIASFLRVTPKAAKSLLYRARIELRRLLDNQMR